MSESQKVEQVWETPSLEAIVGITKAHVQALETMTDDAVWVQVGMHHLLLRTVGNKTGNEHKVALPVWRDPQGQRIVVASYAGAPDHPSWFRNLADRTSNPRVLCRVQTGQFWSVPEILDGHDYDRIWPLLTADRAWYRDYQAKTERRIPLVRLRESEPA